LHALLHYLVKSKIAKINKPPYHTQLVETVVENILLSWWTLFKSLMRSH